MSSESWTKSEYTLTSVAGNKSPNSPATEVRSYTNLPKEKMSKTWTSVNSPRVNGKLVLRPNPFNSVKSFVTYTPWSQTISGSYGTSPNVYYYNNWSCGVDQTLLTVSNTLWNPLEVSAKDDALREWYRQCAATRGNLLEMYATRQMTANMIASTARRLATAGSLLHRGNLSGAAAALGISWNKPKNIRPAQAWLEMQYGWKPLLSDVYEAINGSFAPPSRFITGRAVARGPFSYTGNPSSATYLKTKCDLTVKVSVCARVTATSALANANQVGLINPALLAWELMPYSFVVDWFAPVSGYLESLTATAGLSISEASTTVTRSYDMAIEKVAGSGLASDTKFRPGCTVEHYRYKNRVTSIPSYLPLPKLKNPVTITHGLNALALLAEAFRRR